MLEKTSKSPLDCKEISPEYSLQDWYWSWSSNTLATWCEELTHWKRPWCWARLKAGGERDDRGWDGWMASLTQWTGVWASSRSWWWIRKPGVLQCMGLQTAGHDWLTEFHAFIYSGGGENSNRYDRTWSTELQSILDYVECLLNYTACLHVADKSTMFIVLPPFPLEEEVIYIT